MRTALLALLAILLGIALGVGIALLRIKAAPWNPDIDRSDANAAAPIGQPDLPAPKVVVDQTSYAFGTLDLASVGRHEFVFGNAGTAPLKLAAGETSCRCMLSSLDDEEVPPGGSTKVSVSWKSKGQLGPYEQTVSVLTNDPDRPKVTLTVSGQITAAIQMLPAELVFSEASATEPSTARAQLLSYLEKPLKIVRYEYSDPTTTRYFDLAVHPLGAEDLKKAPLARSGMSIAVTVKPGLPEGSFRQKITIHTDPATSPAATLSLQGVIGGDIAVVGRGWDADSGILELGTIASREGAQRRLMLVVRGPWRQNVTFKPVKISPNALKVSLGQRSEVNHGAVVQTPLIIDLPPGGPAINRLGFEQAKLGEIVLETTHPQIPRLRILVRMAVEK